uniref:Dual specificity protein phosphatase 19 n=1 Tax=Dendroctonus ponderosae TaxID=77166 RepID=A0AAR5QA02_DENPD
MSLLSALQEKKQQLKRTETIITLEDGRKFAEFKNNIRQLEETSLGFVVDTKPDNIPAKVIDCLYLGSQDCCDLAVLRQYSIKFVLNILDLVETDLEKYLHECMHFVDVCVRNKTNVLVHCNAGISRSASVVIAYLIIKRNLLFDDAYALVKQARATVKPNDGFMKQLQHLKKK